VEIVREDIRRYGEDGAALDALLEGVDCVIHLAAISNDPSAELQPELTEEINFQATVSLAKAAKERGIRFLFSSSCSVYGEADGQLDENGVLNPLTVYAVSKVKSEEALCALADATWRPVILRNGTLFGYSPKMRFDLVVNIFSLYCALHNEIKVFGDGRQWRPFLHVADCARAFAHFAEAGQLPHLVYNVSHVNMRVVDLAEVFRGLRPELKVAYLAVADPDHRDYSVDNRRLLASGFEPRLTPEQGAEGIMEAIVCGLIPDPESVFYRNAKWLKELTQVGTSDPRRMVELMESFHQVRRQQ
jgi:nucleoside-diphosphate-sugar epimerase